MKRNLYRSIALVTLAFALAVTAMIGVSCWQMRQATPLQTEVMKTLKEYNESNPDNAQLAEQIRQLDLLSRKAYFTQENHIKTGIWILLAMAATTILCLRLYYKDAKDLPTKDLDPIDEWMTKSRARRYLIWGTAGIVSLGLVAMLLTSTPLRDKLKRKPQQSLLASADTTMLFDENNPKGDSNKVLSEDTLNNQFPDVSELSEGLSTSSLSAVYTSSEKDVIVSSDAISTTSSDATSSTTQADIQEAPADTFPTPKLTWNAFRGNSSSGRSAARGIPTTWNLKSGKNILWQKAVPKHGYNSPVVNGRNIFLTGADDQSRELYCYDLWTGELRWTLKADNISSSPSTMPDVSEDTGLAASTVATNGKQVCAIFATGDIICADMDGKRLWAKNLGIPDNHYGFASSLLMYGNELLVQYDNNSNARLLALSATTGREIWSKSRTDKIAWSSPIITKVAGSQAVVVAGNPAITAYKLSDGEQLWRVECMSGEVGASPCSSDGIVYAASEYATCIAINAESGETLWEAGDYLPECSSPVATKDMLYVATSYGAVCAYSTESGEVLVQHELTTPFYSSPVIADGKVWLFSNSGKCYIFSRGKDFRLITSFDTGEPTFATPAFTDGMMIVRTDKSLYVVKKSS
ncbi:MAG: PQQ-like beta-propeller repeat protein [Bacteroidaceae bacterium]|nr:PQQ-like beta-propeller repeat protein [Bacteroidaceae bacterium]